MKKLALALVLVAGIAASASAADRAVSKSTLNSMGLSSMQVMSDNDGLAVRGKGTFAFTWGGSSANFLGQQSVNNYSSGSTKFFGGPSGSKGGSVSFGGIVGGVGSGSGFIVGGIGGVSGGGASAYAW